MLRFRLEILVTALLFGAALCPSVTLAQISDVARHEFEVLQAASKDNYDRWVANIWGLAPVILVAMGWVLTSKNARAYLNANTGARVGALGATILVAFANALSQMYFAHKSRILGRALWESELAREAGWGSIILDQWVILRFNEGISMAIMLLLFGVLAYMIWSLRDWKEPEVAD